MLGEYCVVGISEDVVRMAGRHVREEVVGVADHEAWFIEGKLCVEKVLGKL